MDEIELRADILAQKIRHFIITSSGHTCQNASIEEFYQAFCATLKEEVMINWTASNDTMDFTKERVLYFLSMEYLPGRLLGNNITNIGATELVKAVLSKLNRNMDELISCETEAGLGNGGLGRLSSCFLDSLATLHYPSRAYGLRYQYGIFEQEIWNGIQVEKPDCWLLNNNPWESRRDTHAVNVHFKGTPIHVKNKHGDCVALLEDFEEVRVVPFEIPIIGYSESAAYSVRMLRLWSTKDSPRNFQLQRYNAGFFEQAAENTTLTDVLYPNDNNELGKRIRLKQEFLLVSASLQDIIRRHLRIYGDLSQFGDKARIQINDTHPALIVAELIRTLTKNFDYSWGEAIETCKTVCSYTNHTILKEGLEEWNAKRVLELLPRQHLVIEKLNQEFCDSVREKYPGDEEKVQRLSVIENGQIRMSHLSILGSHKVNGVAKIHSEILQQKLFKDFAEMFPQKFTNVTNGVTQRRWLLHANPLLSDFITKRIGNGWITDFRKMERLLPFALDEHSQKEFLAIKKKNKESLITYLTHENAIRDQNGKIIAHSSVLSPSALFDVQIKRFHEYKRQLMNALFLIMTYLEICDEKNAPPLPRLSLFAGKAAPGYVKAKQILDLTFALGRKCSSDPRTKNHLAVVFLENYNVSKAEIIIPAADLSEQISLAGWEASGTGNMKLTMNGALTIGTEDGANVEMQEAIGSAWPFSFGASAEQNLLPYRPWDVYSQDAPIRRAVDSLVDGTFSTNALEEAAFAELHEYLTSSDPFRILQDLRAYCSAQKKVEALFASPMQWAKTALQNIAKMGPFSADESIRNYANKIWEIKPCPPNPGILEKVRQEYSEHDRCQIKKI